jgi:hypothetical protein
MMVITLGRRGLMVNMQRVVWIFYTVIFYILRIYLFIFFELFILWFKENLAAFQIAITEVGIKVATEHRISCYEDSRMGYPNRMGFTRLATR